MIGGYDIRGVIVPLVSPFTPSGATDTEAVQRIVSHTLDAGVTGIFVLGTTGEASAMLAVQKNAVLHAAKLANDGRATLYAGVSMNSAGQTIDAAHRVYALGAHIAVAHPPADRSITGDACYNYFQNLADKFPLPLILYNIPKTTDVSIPIDVIERLAAHPNILGLKDSENDALRLEEVLTRVGGRDDFAVLVGCAALSSFGLRRGADGLVPSTANLEPALYQRLYQAAVDQDWDEADRLQRETDLLSASYQSGRPLGESLAQLKKLLAEQGLCGPTVVIPMQPALGESA